jgi:hypothetical protein
VKEAKTKNCHEIITGYELVVVECSGCRMHIGVDATYLRNNDVKITCPNPTCKKRLVIKEIE